MEIDFDTNVRPFFQVLVLKVDAGLTCRLFFRKFKAAVNEKNNHSSSHLIKIMQPAREKDILEDSFLSALIEHKQVPTWYKQDTKIDLSTDKKGVVLDVEYDVLVFYQKHGYVFLHTNCSLIFSLINKTFEDLFIEEGIQSKKLKGSQLNLILNQFEIEYRSLGIQNHFGCGGTAPDSKTYFSRDASNSLTNSFDSGYGFSYCIGSLRSGDNTRIPFGCSKSKSKIWTTWIDDLNEFCEQCESIIKWLNTTESKFTKLEVLVQAVEADIITTLEPIEFFLDYFIQDKGLVFLGKESFALDWYCIYDGDSDVLSFIVNEDGIELKVELRFVFDPKNLIYNFYYLPGSSNLKIAVTENTDDVRGRRSVDIVEFLNKQHSFTILYGAPYAYRDEECWENNTLKKVFGSMYDIIDWKEVDITKESKKSLLGKINILQKLDQYFLEDRDTIFCCEDNGANEIADYIALFENKIVLIHAKYATDQIPKLLIGDIQVVASQALKNTRFFLSEAYSESILNRLYKKASKKGKFPDYTSFRQYFFRVLNSKDTERECWIVQPGVSIKKLKEDKLNKMHTILNHVEGTLRVNNILFKLIANNA